MKNQKTLIAGLALALTFGAISFSGAQEGGMHHMGMDKGKQMMHSDMMGMDGTMRCNMINYTAQKTTLTPEQQKKVEAIETKYATELANLQTAMMEKRTAMQTAMNDDTTTMGSMKTMRGDMMTIRQDMQALHQKINQEISTEVGMEYSANMMNCPMHQGKDGHMKMGTMMGSGGMAHGKMMGRHCQM